MNTYLDKINLFISQLDSETLSALDEISIAKTFKKGEFLLRQDDVCKSSYFIEKGIVRKYYLNDGKEITTELIFENDLAISFESYLTQCPSREFIQAISDITVSKIDYYEFREAKKQYPKLMELDLMLTEYYAIWLEDRLFQFHTLDATQRYSQLLTRQSHIVHYVPLTYIASYLGISLETLSRIRAKI